MSLNGVATVRVDLDRLDRLELLVSAACLDVTRDDLVKALCGRGRGQQHPKERRG